MSLHGSQKNKAARYAQASVSRPRTRTAKACDRCRFKKSKCDGGRPCGRCVRFDNPCVYGKPSSKARGKHHMSEILDVMAIGLRRLYTSCVNSEGFPGVLSEKHIREMEAMDVQIPTTHAILEALGLIKFERTGKGQGDEQDGLEHEESYWHQLRPDRPLVCHSPEYEARSTTDSEETSPEQQIDDSTRGDEPDTAPTSATESTQLTFSPSAEHHSITSGQPALPRDSNMQQYVSMMQSRYYMPSQDIPLQPVAQPTSTGFVDPTFNGGFYTTIVPSRSGEDHMFLSQA